MFDKKKLLIIQIGAVGEYRNEALTFCFYGNCATSYLKLKNRDMTKEELIEYTKWLFNNSDPKKFTKASKLVEYYYYYYYSIHCSPSHETSKVGNNEQAKEVCCDNCNNAPISKYCSSCTKHYSNWQPKQTG